MELRHAICEEYGRARRVDVCVHASVQAQGAALNLFIYGCFGTVVRVMHLAVAGRQADAPLHCIYAACIHPRLLNAPAATRGINVHSTTGQANRAGLHQVPSRSHIMCRGVSLRSLHSSSRLHSFLLLAVLRRQLKACTAAGENMASSVQSYLLTIFFFETKRAICLILFKKVEES